MTPRARRVRSFYDRALDAADRTALAEARSVEGVDDEVALLRLQVRHLVESGDADPRVLQGAVRLLVQTLIARHRLSGGQVEGLSEAAARLIEEFGALFNAGDGANA